VIPSTVRQHDIARSPGPAPMSGLLRDARDGLMRAWLEILKE
jgi:hypothetical protein